MIEAVVERCAGIDVGKKFVLVCVMTGGAKDEPHTQIKKFGTIVQRTRTACRMARRRAMYARRHGEHGQLLEAGVQPA